MFRCLFIAMIAMFSLTACQTSMIHSFEKVEKGMDKSQVLQIVGEPTSTTRMHGQDRWLYRFYDDKVRYDREVHFKDGLVVYSGTTATPPERSAETEDQRKAVAEEALQADERARDEARKNNAQMFRDYEDETHGKNGKVEYMPTFQEK